MTTNARPGFRLPWAPGPDETPVAEEAQETAMMEPADANAEASQPEAAVSPPGRRTTKFMAELSRAMQSAAETSRAETMARFEVEAKGVVEEIHATAANEAADLRRKADDDVVAIRDWSKAEIARIREETETRIAARKSALDSEMERHAATIEARTERVAAVVAAFEAQMADFFERLNAEEDPTRIATMAETMPDPPSLAEPTTESVAAGAAVDTGTDIDFAAAEAEAASLSGDLETDDDLPEGEDTQLDAAADEAPGSIIDGDSAAELSSTRVIVSGLVSVANIANFKRSLGRLPGVSTIAVASGPDGDFIFNVGHALGSTLSTSVQTLPGFEITITGESGDAINVAARDRDATG